MTDWTYPASTSQRVVDGDTFVAVLTRDLGFHATVTWVQRFRLNRINAAPAATVEGKAATAYLVSLLPGAFLLDSVAAYKYGDEWMAEVTLPDGTNVSDAMVAAGHALYWDGHGPRPGGLPEPSVGVCEEGCQC